MYRSRWTLAGWGAELVGIEVAPHGHDEVDRQLEQSGKDAREQIAGLEVEHGAEGEVDCRCAGQLRQLGRRGVATGGIERGQTK